MEGTVNTEMGSGRNPPIKFFIQQYFFIPQSIHLKIQMIDFILTE